MHRWVFVILATVVWGWGAPAQAQAPGSVYQPLPARCRVADSRLPGVGALAGASRYLNVTDNASFAAQGGTGSSSSCGIPANATAFAVSVTALPTATAGYLKIYPAGGTLADGNTVSYASSGTGTNDVIVSRGSSGGNELGIFSSAVSHYIVDIVGYFQAGRGKFLHLDVLGHPSDTAVYTPGYGAISGLGFRDGWSDDAAFSFVLPADYTPATTIFATMTWHTNAVSCGVSWRENFTSVSRAGLEPFDGVMSVPTGPGAGAMPNTVQSASFTLGASTPLAPGDKYNFGIFRHGGALSDTCPATARLDSLVIEYQ